MSTAKRSAWMGSDALLLWSASGGAPRACGRIAAANMTRAGVKWRMLPDLMAVARHTQSANGAFIDRYYRTVSAA